MPATITATEVKNHFGKVVRRIYKEGETLIVERGGLPVLVMMPLHEYQAMRERRFVAFSRQLGQAAEAQGLTEEELMAELEGDKQAIYKETYHAEATA